MLLVKQHNEALLNDPSDLEKKADTGYTLNVSNTKEDNKRQRFRRSI
jgi:hypothetical protein